MTHRVARLVLGLVLSLYLGLTVILSNPFDPGGGLAETRVVVGPRSCDGGEEGVVLVHSYAGHVEMREAQRKAKGILGAENLRFIFILFTSPEVDMGAVMNESKTHGDILLGERQESYRGLVFKHILGISWLVQHCSQVKYVIKMDDDISVDFPRLLSTASPLLTSPLHVAGLLQLRLPILRGRGSKWSVAREELQGSHYPPFLSGWCYVGQPQAFRAILDVLQGEEDTFWVDDVWVTGLLGAKAGLQLVSLNMYYTVYKEHLGCCVAQPDLKCPYIVAPTDWSTGIIVQAAEHNNRWATHSRFFLY